jgi:predicted phage replisome organizer
MSEIKWIKLSTTMFEDEKIRLIESMPDSDTVLVIWIKLLALAGKTNATGYIFLNQNIPYTDEMLSTIFNRPLNTIRFALQTFKQFGMIEIDENEFISISNWEKHQNIEGMEKIKEQTRKRVSEHRERKKLLIDAQNVTLPVTQCNATEEDIDKNKDIAQIDIQFTEFWSIYPNKKDRKRSYEKFKSAVKKHGFEKVIEGTKGYIRECELNKTEKQYIKHGATFLHGECYLNDYVVPATQQVIPTNYKSMSIGD